jgi:two-component system, response regulator PdtaR
MTYHAPPPVAVLVVDEEPVIRMVARDMVEDAGFAALEASNASEAIEVLKAHQDICILFTDVNMPGSMDGLDLARHVDRRWPGVRILVTTGRGEVAAQDLPAGCSLIGKPYRLAQLVEKLRGLAAASALCDR